MNSRPYLHPMITLRNHIKNIPAAEQFLTILFLCLFLAFLCFNNSLNIFYISMPFKIVSAAADSTLIILPCTLLRGRWKSVAVTIPFIQSGLLLANLIYYRNFEDLIQPSAYLHADIWDPTVVGGAASSLLLSDIVFLILPLIPLTYLIYNRHKVRESSATTAWRLCIVTIFSLTWSLSYAGVIRRKSLGEPYASLKGIITDHVFSKEIVTWRGIYETHNFCGYLIRCAVAATDIGMNLSPGDINEIKAHLSEAASRRVEREVADSVVGKSLIMIIVESLPFNILENPEGRRLIPNIMELTTDSSTIVSRCRVLTGYGRSSDAQFMFNTGLLPLRNEAFADNYAVNDYPSIAKALEKPSMEIIGEKKGLWYHSHTTESYGFDALADAIAPTGMDQDSIIFNRAEREIARLESPFFLFITSISMHDPYDSRKVSDDSIYAAITADDSRDREYYARLSHFDRSLGRFVTFLQQEGKFEESVIVILGDHEIRASKISPRLHDSHVPFIIINSPIKGKHRENSTQLDVFPTILDMLRCSYSYMGVPYSGLGKSLFSPDKHDDGTTPSDEDYRISEMIIKGRPKE